MLANREMKQEIHSLQVKLEQTEGSVLDTVFRDKQLAQDKRDYYMPSSRGPSSRNSSNARMSGSLVQAGQSIAFQQSTIETPNRNHEKRGLAKRLE